MYNPPARPVPKWLVAKVNHEVRAELNRQLKEDYGIDPRTQVLVLAVQMKDGSTEYRAFGATYLHRNTLKAAGFRWDSKRGLWCTPWTPNWAKLAGVPYVRRDVA